MTTSCRSLRLVARLFAAVALVAAALAAGCGGGVDTGGTGRAVTFTAGRIDGFGSVVVGGIRFDDDAAEILDDAGMPRSRADLRLGMQARVEAGPVTVDPASGVARAAASVLVFGSQVRGPVQAVDAARGRLVVIGQDVTVDAATAFDGFSGFGGGLDRVRVGQSVEVHAFFDAATATYAATRIALDAAPTECKLVGPVADLDPATKSFAIGRTRVLYADVAATDLAALAEGATLRVRMHAEAYGGSTWDATALAPDAPSPADGTGVRVEGYVAGFAGPGRFGVGGLTVDAAGPGVVFEGGDAARLADGARVAVEGTVRDGVLVARRVAFAAGGAPAFELHGAVESLDAPSRRFAVRGVAVTWSGATRFDGGTAADLRVGAAVEVAGGPSADGGVAATRVRFGR